MEEQLPKEKKPEIVFRIIDRSTGDAVGSYSRACHDEYDFPSAYKARLANCHGLFTDTEQFKIAKYRVTYELIEDDCDIEEDHKKFYQEDLKRIKTQ